MESMNAIACRWFSSAAAGSVNSCTSGAPGSQTMHMRTATVLPLKPQPVVPLHKGFPGKALEELLESLKEKPVSYSWVVSDCMSVGTCILWTILADQVCKFWPLHEGQQHYEEDSRKSKSINHAWLSSSHCVSANSPERTSIVASGIARSLVLAGYLLYTSRSHVLCTRLRNMSGTKHGAFGWACARSGPAFATPLVVADTAGKRYTDHVTQLNHRKVMHPQGVDECRHDQFVKHASVYPC